MNQPATHISPPAPPSFYSLDRSELSERLGLRGVASYRADQLFSWVYRKHLRRAEGMANLPADLRRGLDQVCDLALPEVASVRSTGDGQTHKFVLRLPDHAEVECVSMRSDRRLTLC